MNAEREHKHLAQADRHIAELKKDIARQWQIIEELSMGGQPLHEEISTLRLLKDHLRIMERHRQSILDELERRIRQQRRGYASEGLFTTAQADSTTTEPTRKQVPSRPGERSRQSPAGKGLPPICIRPAIGFIANTPLATRAGVVSSVVVRAIPSKKAMTSYAPHVLGPSIWR